MLDGVMGMGWMMLVGGLIGLVVLALLIVGVVWLVRSRLERSSRTTDGPYEDAAERAVRQSYVLGEIDEDEYVRQLRNLRRHDGGR